MPFLYITLILRQFEHGLQLLMKSISLLKLPSSKYQRLEALTFTFQVKQNSIINSEAY